MARYHGDQAAAPGMLDFAVNVRHAHPPQWLIQRLAARLPDLARYPSAEDLHRAQDAVAQRHGRARDEVVPLAGAAEGFALLPNLRPARAAIIAPSFTEPAVALSAAGVPVHHVVLRPPFGLDGALETGIVPEDADLVVVGNPTNPTSVLHRREQLLALRRPGRILVVDEAFADSVPGEPESLAADALADVLVLRSLTKSWALAGLRVGYGVGAVDRPARALAGGHAAIDGHRRLLCRRRGCRRGSRCGAAGPIAHRYGGRPGVGGRRGRRRPGPVRAVPPPRCRSDAKQPARQGYCRASL
jgi:histidinol-phosphate aminotransferase